MLSGSYVVGNSLLQCVRARYCVGASKKSLLYHRVLGKKEATSSIMILHGLFGSTTNWSSIASALTKQELYDQVILVDLRNHGKSFHDSDFSVPAMTEDIERLTHHLNLPADFTLMGHSLGGKVSMDFALQGKLKEPSKLIVVDIAPIHYETASSFSSIINALCNLNISSGRSRKDIEKEFEDILSDEGPMVRAFLLTNLEQTSSKEWKWRVNLPAIRDSLKNVGELPHTSKDKQTNITTHFIGGANSDYIPKDSKEQIQQYFPNSTIDYIENSGHWVHYENPKQFIASIANFRKETKKE